MRIPGAIEKLLMRKSIVTKLVSINERIKQNKLVSCQDDIVG